MHRRLLVLFPCALFALCAQAQTANQPKEPANNRNVPQLKARFTTRRGKDADVDRAKRQVTNGNTSGMLPLWLFNVESTRDGNDYTGVMVGRDPFNGGGSASVPTYVIPVTITTSTIGVDFNFDTGDIKTTPGYTTFSPNASDFGCLTPPNDVPVSLFKQSPIFKSATFDFGGTVVGTTQYTDAFQRGSFWKVDDHDTYHVLLGAHFTQGITIRVPAAFGTTLPESVFPSCGPMGIVDIDWFDTYLDNAILPQLHFLGINPATFPIFLVHNVVWASPVTNLGGCCFLGYHGITGYPIQTYSAADFDSTGLFGTGAMDTGVASHEVAEWMNDPFVDNPTPPWGGTGQVQGFCQSNLEVGDPLSGSEAPRIAMPNGFTYHLQELAFFSWFYGAPSIGVNGWFSDNGTFLTDAGPSCESFGPGSGSGPHSTPVPVRR